MKTYNPWMGCTKKDGVTDADIERWIAECG